MNLTGQELNALRDLVEVALKFRTRGGHQDHGPADAGALLISELRPVVRGMDSSEWREVLYKLTALATAAPPDLSGAKGP